MILRAPLASVFYGALAVCALPASAATATGGERLLLTVQGRGPEGGAANNRTAVPLNTIGDMFAALQACWIPPPAEEARPNMQITVRMSFKRNGELLGEPRITYETPGIPENTRLAYREAVAATVKRCVPLPFSDRLGNSIAGRPVNIRFVDQRGLKQAENQQ